MATVMAHRQESIARLLPLLPLSGLVAIFSAIKRDDLLLVYLDDHADEAGEQSKQINFPPTHQEHVDLRVTNLSSLTSGKHSNYDGPIVAFAAIAQLDPSIPTKGQRFCRLDRLLRQAGRVEPMAATMSALATYLETHTHPPTPTNTATRTSSPDRVQAQLIGLRLPIQLSNLADRSGGLRGLIAYIPESDAPLWLPRNGPPTLEQFRSRPHTSQGETVICLAEVRPLIEATSFDKNRFPIDLRTALHRSGMDQDLTNTEKLLAAAFYDSWTRTETAQDKRIALSLALEAHLTDADVDDLVAVLPNHDFHEFLESGRGLYVYRRLLNRDGSTDDNGITRIDLKKLPGAVTQLRNGSVCFSLLPLRSQFQGDPETTWLDLAPVLRRARRTEIFTRNSWLLVEDFLEDRVARKEYRVPAEDLTQTMVACCQLLGLTDPWRARQGRHDDWLLNAYGTLHRAIDILIGQSPQNDTKQTAYYTALKEWYGLALLPECAVTAKLELMLHDLESAKRNERNRQAIESPIHDHRINELTEVVRTSLELIRTPFSPSSFDKESQNYAISTRELLHRTAETAEALPLVNDLFKAQLQDALTLLDTFKYVESSQIPLPVKTMRLHAIIAELRALHQMLYAPEHQRKLLSHLLDRITRESERRVDALKGGVVLQAELQSRSITAAIEHEGLIFHVKNTGNAVAHDLEIELLPNDALIPQHGPPRKTLNLRAGEEKEVRFPVRVVTDYDSLKVRCRVTHRSEHETPQQWNYEFQVHVTWADSSNFVPKTNPYFFGPKVHDYEQFFGRRDELQEILAHLAGRRPQHVLVRGARRTGKSSLLNVLHAVIVDSDTRQRPVREWFDLPTSWDNALNATVAVDFDLQGSELANQHPSPTAFYRSGLAALEGSGIHTPLGHELRGASTISTAEFVHALRAAVDSTRGRHLVILVDEFDILDRLGNSSFYETLRHVISVVSGCTWVVASALGLSQQVSRYDSPLFNIFKIIDLGPLGYEAAARLVLSPWDKKATGDPHSAAQLHFADDAVYRIVREAGEHPYFVQMLCSHVVDHANRARISYIQEHNVMGVIDAMVGAEPKAQRYLDYLWQAAGPLGKVILYELVQEPGSVDREKLRMAVRRKLTSFRRDEIRLETDYYEGCLQQLTDVSAIRAHPNGTFEFAVPLLRRLVLRRSDKDLNDSFGGGQ